MPSWSGTAPCAFRRAQSGELRGFILSALGHVAVGFAIGRYAFGERQRPIWERRGLTAALIAVALLPDLDLLAEHADLAVHRGASHSIVFAVIVACGFAAVAWFLRQSPARWGAAFFMAAASHGLLDLFTIGPGIELLWPLTEASFEAPWRPLPSPPVGPDLLSQRGVMRMAFEAIIFTPLVAWSLWQGSGRR